VRSLTWSRTEIGNLNGKVGPYTFFTVAYHTAEKGYFVFPKLPGLKSLKVSSTEEGCLVATKMYKDFFCFLEGMILENRSDHI